MDFQDVEACHAAALETFLGIDVAVDVRAMEIPEGQEMLESTMIAYGADGNEIGMYACSVLRAGSGSAEG